MIAQVHTKCQLMLMDDFVRGCAGSTDATQLPVQLRPPLHFFEQDWYIVISKESVKGLIPRKKGALFRDATDQPGLNVILKWICAQAIFQGRVFGSAANDRLAVAGWRCKGLQVPDGVMEQGQEHISHLCCHANAVGMARAIPMHRKVQGADSLSFDCLLHMPARDAPEAIRVGAMTCAACHQFEYGHEILSLFRHRKGSFAESATLSPRARPLNRMCSSGIVVVLRRQGDRRRKSEETKMHALYRRR
jgi:hypothetical protein